VEGSRKRPAKAIVLTQKRDVTSTTADVTSTTTDVTSRTTQINTTAKKKSRNS